MSLTLTQVAVTSAAAVLVTAPTGSTVLLIASASTNVGTTSAVTTSTGFVLPAAVPVPFSVPDYLGQQPVTLYAITASTSTVSVAVSD